MSRTLMIAVVFAGLALVFAIVLIRREPPVTAASPAAQYAIPQDQLKYVTAKANAGDCEAAGALANYYLNIELDLDAGIKWSRLGATCPGVYPKERLLALLVQLVPSDANSREIIKLLDEIRQLDPAEADSIARAIPAEHRVLDNSGGDRSTR